MLDAPAANLRNAAGAAACGERLLSLNAQAIESKGRNLPVMLC